MVRRAKGSMYVLVCPVCEMRSEFADEKEARFRPFCGERCKMIDLGRWFNGEYRISAPLHSSLEGTDETTGEDADGSAGNVPD